MLLCFNINISKLHFNIKHFLFYILQYPLLYPVVVEGASSEIHLFLIKNIPPLLFLSRVQNSYCEDCGTNDNHMEHWPSNKLCRKSFPIQNALLFEIAAACGQAIKLGKIVRKYLTQIAEFSNCIRCLRMIKWPNIISSAIFSTATMVCCAPELFQIVLVKLYIFSRMRLILEEVISGSEFSGHSSTNAPHIHHKYVRSPYTS